MGTKLIGFSIGRELGALKGLRDIRGVEGRYWHENVSARPTELREKADAAISCNGPGPTTKEKEITSSREEKDVTTNMCPCGTIESRTHIEGKCTRRNGMRCRGDQEMRRM